jgi:hypothetical protein
MLRPGSPLIRLGVSPLHISLGQHHLCSIQQKCCTVSESLMDLLGSWAANCLKFRRSVICSVDLFLANILHNLYSKFQGYHLISSSFFVFSSFRSSSGIGGTNLSMRTSNLVISESLRFQFDLLLHFAAWPYFLHQVRIVTVNLRMAASVILMFSHLALFTAVLLVEFPLIPAF